MQLTPLEGGFLRLQCGGGHVRAEVLLDEHGNVDIYAWSCDQPGRGHTTRALSELNARFARVGAVGIGADPQSPSWRYWMHMASKGLVQFLVDDDANPVAVPQPTPHRSHP